MRVEIVNCKRDRIQGNSTEQRLEKVEGVLTILRVKFHLFYSFYIFFTQHKTHNKMLKVNKKI
jgi:hypothetical protein